MPTIGSKGVSINKVLTYLCRDYHLVEVNKHIYAMF